MDTMGRLARWLILLALLHAGGCILDDDSDDWSSRPTNVSKDQLRAAPETLHIGGIVLTAHAELWRDFMPVSPPSGSPLSGVVDLSPSDSAAGIPPVIEAYVWMMKDPDVWTTRMERQGPAPTGGGERFRFSGGPKWGPGISVDVIVGVRTSPDHVALLSAGKVPIRRVE